MSVGKCGGIGCDAATLTVKTRLGKRGVNANAIGRFKGQINLDDITRLQLRAAPSVNDTV